MRIILADLVHDYQLSNNIPVPVGIGMIGANLKYSFPDQVDVQLIKSPNKLLDVCTNGPAPDMVGLSNYSWNFELNRFMIGRLKATFPEVVIFSGGPNIRNDHAGIGAHLKAHPELDFYCMHGAEIPMRNMIGHFLGSGLSPETIRYIPEDIRGVAFLRDGEVLYKSQDRDKGDFDLDALPSPYLTGILDDFVTNPQWVPFIESNRGCPFRCTFCAWGVALANYVYKFPLQRVLDEIDYLVDRSKADTWYLVDANFGQHRRDVEIAEALRVAMTRSKTFSRIRMNWAKNSSSHTTKIAALLGEASEPMVALQSLDDEVLAKVKRGNIKVESLRTLQDHFEKEGRETQTDVLVGLPGESLSSHFETLRGVFDHGFMGINLNQIRMLPGTEMEMDASRTKFGLLTKHRMVSDTWGIYDNTLVVETEESLVGSNDMSFDDMMYLRKVHFLIWALWNSRLAQPILRWMHRERGINPLDTILHICNPTPGGSLDNLLTEYQKEARAEWHESPDAVLQEVSNRVDELENGEFTKLNLKYLAKILLDQKLSDEILLEIARCAKSPEAIELANFCVDRLFDFNNQKRTKTKDYPLSVARALRIAYPNIPEGASRCEFTMSHKTFNSIRNDLKKFNFKNNPVWAVSVTLQAFSNSFMYDMRFKEDGAIQETPNHNNETFGAGWTSRWAPLD